jgi:hypothetical protein
MDEGTAMTGTTSSGSKDAAAGPVWTNQQAMGTYGDVIRLVVGPHR